MSVASSSDIRSLGDFILGAWRKAGPRAWGWTGATDASIHELASAKYLQQLTTNPNVKILLARDRTRILGFAASRKVDDRRIELAGIIVSESETGTGIGTALMNASLESALAGGFEEMIVKTETFNTRAIGFYEAKGFRRTGTESEEVEGKSVSLAVLKRKLSNKGPWSG